PAHRHAAERRPATGGGHPAAHPGDAQRSGLRGGGGYRLEPARRRHRRRVRLRLSAVPRRPAPSRRRPRREPSRRGAAASRRAAAPQGLNASGMAASLDLLGESVTSLSEARAARDTYLETLDRIRTVGADANVSVKLTQMGLEVDERVCVENLRAIMARARSYGTFVRIDMEQSAYTENTLQLFKRTFHPEFGNV